MNLIRFKELLKVLNTTAANLFNILRRTWQQVILHCNIDGNEKSFEAVIPYRKTEVINNIQLNPT